MTHSQPRTARTSVLIIGAGPTGLLGALCLARRGVAVRIIDRNAGPVETSRAMGVQARTLEFYAMLGMADEAIALGSVCDRVSVRRRGEETATFSLSDMGEGLSPYPFMLTLAQDVHERFLLRKLAEHGVEVERDTVFRSLEQDTTHVRATVERAGTPEVIRSDWLVAADGVSSDVRGSLGVGFGGGTSSGLFYVADAKIENGAGNAIMVGFGADTLALLMPVRTSGMKRLIGIVPPELSDRDDLVAGDILPLAEDLLGVRTTEVNWFSTYRVHHRVADRFRVGRCFIAGDAGHVHSPVGGQGMNTGLGDAVNLAWKLADVIQARADTSVLDSYHVERHAFATTLIETTDAAFQRMIAPGWLGRFLRLNVAPNVIGPVTRLELTQRTLFRTVSQIKIAYPDSELSGEPVRGAGVSPGDRLPWDDAQDNHTVLDGLGWQFHTYGAVAGEGPAAAQAMGLPVHSFAGGAQVGLDDGTSLLLRPDGYVALVSPDARVLRDYAESHGLAFAPPRPKAALAS